MDQNLVDQLHPRTTEEIVAELRELIRRHRRRYIRKYMRPCPNNCTRAILQRNKVTGCGACLSTNPEQCQAEQFFQPLETKDELFAQFAEDIHDVNILRHEYRDLLVLMWVLGIPLEEEVVAEAMDTISEGE